VSIHRSLAAGAALSAVVLAGSVAPAIAQTGATTTTYEVVKVDLP